jgi:single-strand DNA-binding protein
MLNKVTLMGNVGHTPKLYLTQDGKEMMTFSLATTQCWKACSREGEESEWQFVTDWHQITVFQENAIQWMKDMLKQGDPVYVKGKLSYPQWKDKYSPSHFTSHIVVTEEDGGVRCLHRSVSFSQPAELKILNLGLNASSTSNVNPSPIFSPESHGMILSREEAFSSEKENGEQDFSLETEPTEALAKMRSQEATQHLHY